MKHREYAVHFIYGGIIVLLAGLQMHAVEAYRLTPAATSFLAHNVGPSEGTAEGALNRLMVGNMDVRKTISPPSWLSWGALSCGGVFAAHGMLLIFRKR